MVSSGGRTDDGDRVTEDMVQREVRGEAPYDPLPSPPCSLSLRRAGL